MKPYHCQTPCRQQEWAGVIAQQLDPAKHTVVLCHHGMRSQMVRHLFVAKPKDNDCVQPDELASVQLPPQTLDPKP